MILTAHQPVYIPWCGLISKTLQSHTFCLFDNVQYLPRDWNNRNRIKTPTGAQWLTVPVHTKGYRDKPIRLIEINNDASWRRKHWRAIETSYAKAPYFDVYAAWIRDVYEQDWEYLIDLNEYVLQGLLTILGIRIDPLRADVAQSVERLHRKQNVAGSSPAVSSIKYVRASDYNFRGQKSDLVLDMCKTLGASEYIFGSQGRNYADVDAFEAAGVRVRFQEYDHPVYAQMYGEFESHLSVIDLLMNAGDESLNIILGRNPHHERRGA